MQGCITKRTPPLSHTAAHYPKAKPFHSNPREHKLPNTTEGPLQLLLLMLSFGRERGALLLDSTQDNNICRQHNSVSGATDTFGLNCGNFPTMPCTLHNSRRFKMSWWQLAAIRSSKQVITSW